MTKTRQIEGTMRFVRFKNEPTCSCCPGGIHVSGRYIKTEPYITDWLWALCREIPEGAKVRISVEWEPKEERKVPEMKTYQIKPRTARKSHRCAWCGEPILPNSKYVEHRYIGEDGPTTDRFHDECDVAMKNSEIGDDGFALYQQERGLTIDSAGQCGTPCGVLE